MQINNDILEIYKMLTLSTAHIKPETAKWLDKANSCSPVYKKDEFGWFIFIDYSEKHDNIPKDLAKVIDFAKKNGCSWLCLDRDANETKLLPVYDLE